MGDKTYRRDITVPTSERRFEDYEVGSVCEFGPITLTQAEIIDFANIYDPQSFHIDPEAAATGPFGGIIASGLHTFGMAFQILVKEFLPTTASLGSPGLDELRWLRPVRPGDLLTVRITVVEARRSSSKPDRGIVRTEWKMLDQDDQPVLTVSGLNLIAVRDRSPDREPANDR
ncbi:MaoC family dehydratase [Pseudonocardiaceae bacterium YIM PH 21723]|nr:MaoC family dehydratase [Pseudonocardiaceae bacterium YIM PH 21723]